MEKICIVCPIGCKLTIEKYNSEIGYNIKGNNCNRGKEYAIKEMTNPTRMVTSTVKIKDHPNIMLPVKTSEAISKDRIFQVMDSIKSIVVTLPIYRNDVIMENLFETGVNLIATRTILESKRR